VDVVPNQSISLLDRVKLQAQVLLPILEALRVELGESRANALIFSALREWSRQAIHEAGALRASGTISTWRC
jgi:hypothetical protein